MRARTKASDNKDTDLLGVREGLDDDDAAAEEGEGLARGVVGEEGEQGLADVAAEADERVAAVALVAQRVEEDLRRRVYV